jgi:hypothetical protein
MRCVQGIVTAAAVLLVAGEVSGQRIVIGYRGSYGPGWGYARTGRLLSSSGFYGGPYGLGFGSVTVVPAYVPRSTIIVVVPREYLSRDRERVREDEPREDTIRIRPRPDREPEPPAESEPERIKAPKPAPRADEVELVPPPQLLEQPRMLPAELPKPRPPDDPAEASARHIRIGRNAFAEGEYGRSAYRFRKASDLTPDQASPHFLLAQASFALGKYRDAVGAIHAGMALDPTWPATGDRFAALYGANNNDFALHLDQFAAARAAHPDDSVLLFLQGVVMWFDGRREDARLLFEKAAPRVPDRRDIDRFLLAK